MEYLKSFLSVSGAAVACDKSVLIKHSYRGEAASAYVGVCVVHEHNAVYAFLREAASVDTVLELNIQVIAVSEHNLTSVVSGVYRVAKGLCLGIDLCDAASFVKVRRDINIPCGRRRHRVYPSVHRYRKLLDKAVVQYKYLVLGT